MNTKILEPINGQKVVESGTPYSLDLEDCISCDNSNANPGSGW